MFPFSFSAGVCTGQAHAHSAKHFLACHEMLVEGQSVVAVGIAGLHAHQVVAWWQGAAAPLRGLQASVCEHDSFWRKRGDALHGLGHCHGVGDGFALGVKRLWPAPIQRQSPLGVLLGLIQKGRGFSRLRRKC